MIDAGTGGTGHARQGLAVEGFVQNAHAALHFNHVAAHTRRTKAG